MNLKSDKTKLEIKPSASAKLTLAEQIDKNIKRKLNAQRYSGSSAWFGLGMMGLIGWSIALPTILGAALGLWLDKHYQVQQSWTLALMVAGLTLGCFTAWNWLSKEHQAMAEDNKDDREENND
jgi:ATP synthase protein I